MTEFIQQLTTIDIVTVISLVLIAVFKQEITNYISTYFYDIRMYINRRYDNDNDPATGQWCVVKEPATGVPALAFLEKYSKPYIFPMKRLVYVWFYFDKYKKKMYCHPFTYVEWRKTPSGRLPVPIEQLSFKQPITEE